MTPTERLTRMYADAMYRHYERQFGAPNEYEARALQDVAHRQCAELDPSKVRLVEGEMEPILRHV